MANKWFSKEYIKGELHQAFKEAIREATRDAINKALNDDEEEDIVNEAIESPYKNLYYSGDMLTIVGWDGSVQMERGVDETKYARIKDAKTQDEINIILLGVKDDESIHAEEEDWYEEDDLHILQDKAGFRIDGKSVYLEGVSIPMPQAIVAQFVKLFEDAYGISFDAIEARTNLSSVWYQIEALKMFWMKLALNAVEESRNQLMTFVTKNDVQITGNGNLVLYRRIVSMDNTNKELTEFISQQYYKVKKNKKSPKNYYVWTNEVGQYELRNSLTGFHEAEDCIGILEQLYLDLPTMESNVYTSQHNKGKYIIKIGEVYKIDESELDTNSGNCHSGGLHIANVNYNYAGYGDVPVVCLLNPSKAITVPTYDSGKLRTTEMFVACINDKPLGVHWDEDEIAQFDEEYARYTMEELQEMCKNKSFAKLEVDGNFPIVKKEDIINITGMIAKRVKQIS